MSKKEVTLSEREWCWVRDAAARIPAPHEMLQEMRRVAVNVLLQNTVGDIETLEASEEMVLTLDLLSWQRKMLAQCLEDPRNQWMAGALPRVWAMRRALGDMAAPTMDSVTALLEEDDDDAE